MAKISSKNQGQNHPQPHQELGIKEELYKFALKAVGLLCTFSLFILVALAAVTLNVFVHWLSAQGASETLIQMLTVAEVMLTALDLAGLVHSTWAHLKH